MIQYGRTVKMLAEVQEHIFLFINVEQLIIAYIFQVQLFNIVLKVITMKHTLKEYIQGAKY